MAAAWQCIDHLRCGVAWPSTCCICPAECAYRPCAQPSRITLWEVRQLSPWQQTLRHLLMLHVVSKYLVGIRKHQICGSRLRGAGAGKRKRLGSLPQLVSAASTGLPAEASCVHAIKRHEGMKGHWVQCPRIHIRSGV